MTKAKKKQKIKEQFDWLIKILLGGMIGLHTLNGMNPLAPAYFSAQASGSFPDFLVFLSISVAIFGRMGMTETIRYAISMITTWILLQLLRKKGIENIHKKAIITGLCLLSVDLVQGIWEISFEKVVFQAMTESFICMGLVILIGKALAYEKHRLRAIEQEELLGWLILLSNVITSLPKEEIKGISIPYVVAIVALLVISYRFGMAEGISAGLYFGAVLTYTGQEASILVPVLFYGGGMFAIPSMVAGLFRNVGRIGTMASFIATLQFLLWQQNSLEPFYLLSAVLAGIFFLCIPKAFVVPIETKEEPIKMDEVMWQQMKLQLKNFAEAFRRLRLTLLGASSEWNEGQATEQILYHTVQEVCNACEYCEYCWNQERQKSYEQASAVVEAIEQVEEESIYEYPFFTTCVRQEPFLHEIRHGYEMAKLELLYNERILEGREAVAGQFEQMAQVIEELFASSYEPIQIEEWQKAKIVQELRRNRIKLAEIVQFKNRAGHREIQVTVRLKQGRMITVRELAQMIGKGIGYPVRTKNGNKSIVGKEYEKFSFMEEPTYYFLQGVAKTSKEETEISGDNFSILEYDAGKLGIMLADGMGSGNEASRKSELLIELLERLLEAGFSKEASLKLLNAVFVAPVSDTNFSTLDLCVVDLYEGTCNFYKIGASASFIRRGDQVVMISGGSIPVGIFPNLDYNFYERQMKEGDMIFLLSDGVMEAVPSLEKESFLAEEIRKLKTDNPQEAVTKLLARVKELGGVTHRDDITIMAVSFWKRT